MSNKKPPRKRSSGINPLEYGTNNKSDEDG